jgi:hypothetical protein
VLLGLQQVLRELAAGVDAFGDLVRTEAQPHPHDVVIQTQRVRSALAGLHEAQSRLDDLLMTRSAPVVLELHAGVLATVKRLLAELDLDNRLRRELRLGRSQRRPTPGATRPAPPVPTVPPAPHVPPEEEPTQDFRLP